MGVSSSCSETFSILRSLRMLVNTLLGVPFNMLRLRITTNSLHVGSGESCNPPWRSKLLTCRQFRQTRGSRSGWHLLGGHNILLVRALTPASLVLGASCRTLRHS
jgi:hypothetical protein